MLGPVFCATVCCLIASLPYLVVAAVKGPGTEFCGGYWRNSTTTSMSAELGGRSIIQVWCFVTGCTLFPLPKILAIAFAAKASEDQEAASEHLETAVGCLPCVFCLYLLFLVGWWICGNIWVLGPGYVPEGCKSGEMGDNTLWRFSQVMLIMSDISAFCCCQVLYACKPR